MNENYGRAAIQLCPNALEVREAKVVVALSIACEQDHTIRLENVIGIGNLVARELLVQEIWQRSEEAIAIRPLISQLGTELIGLPGQVGSGLGILQYTSSW